MLAPVTHILALTSIVRERLLPTPGRVVVKLNQTVSATDVVAEADYSHEHALIDVARILGISGEAADKMITCKVDQQLPEGTLIADGNGLIPRPIKTKRAGRVVAVGGGQVLMDVGDTSQELRAGIPGKVVEIVEKRGVIIQASGALIQGIWGNSRIEAGLLHVLAESPDHLLEASQLDVSLRGAVILAGYCQDAESLKAAAGLPVRGLILSGMRPSLLPLARKMRYPILVTDSFERQPMNLNAYKILSTNGQREISINAEPYDRYSGVHPEAVIPLPVNQPPSPPRDVETFAPGQTVRLRRAPHAGAVGTLTNLRAGLTTLPNGLRVAAGE
ncbi:MAG: hypothetical protein L3J16_04690, partial [Anaerolineales bacterium]|nr:hypothetical protein [Anaerolineales bacterium]